MFLSSENIPKEPSLFHSINFNFSKIKINKLCFIRNVFVFLEKFCLKFLIQAMLPQIYFIKNLADGEEKCNDGPFSKESVVEDKVDGLLRECQC